MKKRRRRYGDRSDGYKLRTIPAMSKVAVYIMKKRSDSQNKFEDSFDVTETEKLCREKVKSGKTNFTLLHVLLAAYVRTVSQRPGINRFISGQKIYARNTIEVVMAVKKEMTLDAPETMIKVCFEPTDTLDQVYEKFNEVVMQNIGESDDSSFDKTAEAFTHIPGLFLKFAIWFLNLLDYFGRLPKTLLKVSPFHGSMIITSMGSLGIKPIYHHLYDFGNLPVFISYGTKRRVSKPGLLGIPDKRVVVDFKVVTDERICDGYYYASAFKLFKKYVEDPSRLEAPPETVIEDVD